MVPEGETPLPALEGEIRGGRVVQAWRGGVSDATLDARTVVTELEGGIPRSRGGWRGSSRAVAPAPSPSPLDARTVSHLPRSAVYAP